MPRCHCLRQFYRPVFWMETTWDMGLAVRPTCLPAFPCSECLPLCPEGGVGAAGSAFRLPSHSPERCTRAPGLPPMPVTHTGQGCAVCVWRGSDPIWIFGRGGLLPGLGTLQNFGGCEGGGLWATELSLSSLAPLLTLYFPGGSLFALNEGKLKVEE